MKITYPICASEGDKYLVMMESFNKSILPDDIANMLGDIEIVDVTLERVYGNNPTTFSTLFEISNIIAGFLLDNENIILYFYCDDLHDIARRNHSITPQKFRSSLFSKMFDGYISYNHSIEIENTLLEIKSDRDVYIHFISRVCHLIYVDAIKNIIMEMESK